MEILKINNKFTDMQLGCTYLVKLEGLSFPKIVTYKGDGIMIRQDFPLPLKWKVEEIIRQF